MKALVIKDRFVNNFNEKDTLGMVKVIGLYSGDEFELATLDSIPNNQKIMIINNYNKFIDSKFEDDEMFFIDYQESTNFRENDEDSCFFSADGKSANPQNEFTAVLRNDTKFDLTKPINLNTIFRPTRFSGIIFPGIEEEDEYEDVIIYPLQVLSSSYDKDTDKWNSIFGAASSSYFKEALEAEHAYKVKLSELPTNNQFDLNNECFLSKDLFEYFSPFAEKIDVINDANLLSVMDRILPKDKEINGPIGKKNRRIILDKVETSKKMTPQRMDRIKKFVDTIDNSEDKISEFFSTRKNVSIDEIPIKGNSKDTEKEIFDLKKDLQATRSAIADLTNKNDQLTLTQVDDTSKDTEIDKLKKLLADSDEIVNKAEDIKVLDFQIKDKTDIKQKLLEEEDGLKKSIKELTDQVDVSNDDFRKKALQVLPYIEMLNITSNKTDSDNEYFKAPDQIEKSFENIDELRSIIHDRMKEQKFQINEMQLNETIFYYLSSRFISFYGKPGTGKTSFARALSNSISGGANDENEDNSYALFQAVESGWSSSEDLFGRSNLFQNRFDFSNPFFKKLNFGSKNEHILDYHNWLDIIFDEATLSPIELYLAKMLGREQEFNQRKNFSINIDSFKFLIPKTLRFLFTMNFDFTTENISDRFIDRCPIILCDNQDDINEEMVLKNYNNNPLSYEKMISVFDNHIKNHDESKFYQLEDLYEQCNPEDGNHVFGKLSKRKENLRKQYFKYMSNQDYENNHIVDSFFVSSIIPSLRGSGFDYQENLEKYLPLIENLERTSSILKNIINRGKNIQSFSFF